MRLRTDCPACGDPEPVTFLERYGVPVHQNLVCTDPIAARAVSRGDLVFTACRRCGFLFNRAFDASRLSYGAAYDNTQDHSPAFGAHVEQLVRDMTTAGGARDARIVEIGCGKGAFLTKLVQEHPGNTGIGFDPAYAGPLTMQGAATHHRASSRLGFDSSPPGPVTLMGGRLKFERRFFGTGFGRVDADIVVCRHVIEHIAEPFDFLGDVREVLTDSPDARLYFETPCAEWILDNQVIWDFFYEHCSLFSTASLSSVFARAGFTVTGVRRVFSGQYLWLEATLSGRGRRTAPEPSQLIDRATEFGDMERRLVAEWGRSLVQLRDGGRVAVWGAGAKGVTFANLLDANQELVDCLVDVNPAKQDGFVPGTGHPIVSPETLLSRRVNQVIVLNGNYREEIRRQLHQLAIPARIAEFPTL